MLISALTFELTDEAFRRGGTDAVAAGLLDSGAILTMLADTMMPESFEHAGRYVGTVTVMGFAVAFLLDRRMTGE